MVHTTVQNTCIHIENLYNRKEKKKNYIVYSIHSFAININN